MVAVKAKTRFLSTKPFQSRRISLLEGSPHLRRELESKTDEEVDFFVDNGYFPEPEDLEKEPHSK